MLVEICARPPHTAFLVVEYNGRQPPRELFADLSMIGWAPPPIAPPPKSAIDWEQHNEVNGERFTIRDYRVEGAVVEPPAGAGPRGSWLPAERSAFFAPLLGVLRRHEVEVVNRVDLPAAAPHNAPSARTTLRGAARRLSLRPDEVVPAHLPAPPPSPPIAFAAGTADAVADDDTRVHVPADADRDRDLDLDLDAHDLDLDDDLDDLDVVRTRRPCLHLVLDPPLVETVMAAVDDLHLAHWNRFATTLATHGTYRGSQHAATRPMVELELWLRPDQIEDVTAALTDAARIDPADEDRFWVSAPDREDAPVGDDGATDELDLVRAVHPCIHLLVDLPLVDVVAAEITASRLLHWNRFERTIETVGTFRGSQHTSTRVVVEFEIWVPHNHLDAMVGALAGYARLDPTNSDRCWISMPVGRERTLEPEPPAATPAPPSPTPAVASRVAPRPREVVPEPAPAGADTQPAPGSPRAFVSSP